MQHDNDCNDNFETNGEREVQRYIKNLSNINSVIFDVGANVGDWSSMLISSNFQGFLVAVDPLKRNLELIEKKLTGLGCEKFELRQLALSDKKGTVEFFTNENESQCGNDSMFDMRTIGSKNIVNSMEVNTDTLDNLSEELGIYQILFLKIDVEGNELSVLKGAKRLLSAGAIDFIQLEFGHAARAARIYLHDIVEFMDQLEYDIFVVKPHGLSPLNFSPFTENRYSQINFLIIHKSALGKISSMILKK